NEPVNWLSHIWNVKTVPKLKDFLWRVVRKAIPVSSNLEKRGLPSFNCKTCGVHEDDLHVFLTCPIAEEVWRLIPTQHTPSSLLPSTGVLICKVDAAWDSSSGKCGIGGIFS
ncbi:hypothetical protein IGI04_018066, partial [Brassica rapa subsp. trilocularis]